MNHQMKLITEFVQLLMAGYSVEIDGVFVRSISDKTFDGTLNQFDQLSDDDLIFSLCDIPSRNHEDGLLTVQLTKRDLLNLKLEPTRLSWTVGDGPFTFDFIKLQRIQSTLPHRADETGLCPNCFNTGIELGVYENKTCSECEQKEAV